MTTRQHAKQLRSNMTNAEHRLWRHLRGHRFKGHKFRRQQPIGPYIVDFVNFSQHLVIEADGGQHNDNTSDQTRDAWLKSQGFTVLRFWNNDILQDTNAVLEAIYQAMQHDE